MGLIFLGLYGVAISLTVIYTLLAVAACRQLLWLQHNTSHGLNTRKLFVMTSLLTSILRVMSFGSMIVLDYDDITFDKSSSKSDDVSSSSSATKEFFDKALIVLFDLPDFCCISAYVLLVVVWAESYLRSRRHWMSSFRFRKFWMLSYFVFNIVLYTAQVTLYSLLFIPQINRTIEANMIYITLASFNIGLPILFTFCYVYLSIMFSGFPFSTIESKLRLQSLSRLGLLWTCSRLAWGLVALTSVVQGWLVRAQRSELFYTIVLISIFIVVEVLPIAFSIQSRSLSSLTEQDIDYAKHHSTGSSNLTGNITDTGYATSSVTDPLLAYTFHYSSLAGNQQKDSAKAQEYRRKDSIDEDDYELENELRPAHADKHLESDEYFNRYLYHDQLKALDRQLQSETETNTMANRQLFLGAGSEADSLLGSKGVDNSDGHSYRTARELSREADVPLREGVDADYIPSRDEKNSNGKAVGGLFGAWW